MTAAGANITKLTVDQEAILPVVREEWLRHGLSTDPADRPAAERGVRLAYEAAGLTPPRVVIWLDSPWAGVVGQAIAPVIVADVLKRSQVGSQVYSQVGSQVRSQVDSQVRSQVDSQVRSQVGSQVGSQVYSQVRQVALTSWYQGLLSGQYWAGYYSWLDAMERIGVTGLEPVHGQQEVARNAGWWWAFKDFAILTERPTLLLRDAQLRLHSEHGPAMLWPDGYALHVWHGQRLPTAPDEIRLWDTAKVLSERNAETRRAMIEIIGWDRVESEFVLVDEDDDPGNAPHKIGLYDLPPSMRDMYDSAARMLLCTNGSVERDGSRRRFGLPVPAHHTKALDAAADLYGWPVEAYRNLEVRR